MYGDGPGSHSIRDEYTPMFPVMVGANSDFGAYSRHLNPYKIIFLTGPSTPIYPILSRNIKQKRIPNCSLIPDPRMYFMPTSAGTFDHVTSCL